VIRRCCLALAALVLGAGVAAADAPTPPQILALIVTNNHSAESGRPELHYADDDGAKYYDLFRMLGGDEDVELLTDFDRDSERLFPEARARAHSPTVAEVHAAVGRLAARARDAARAGRATELYFVFAGHGDVERGRGFLELRDGRIATEDLEAILRDIAATRAHVILDSCNSFFVLSPRRPGGHQIAVTEQAAQSLGQRLPNVGVFLSTSAEAEVFEWSELQSGIFSHAVRSGLAGAADANHDGYVSYDELRAFVDIATSRVKNPLYRPKVFARAPGGRGDAPIVNLAAAHARRIEITGGPTRLTVRDPDELPWLDVHAERDASLTLLVPSRWASHATIDERQPDGAIVRCAMTEGEQPVQLAQLATAPVPGAARGQNELLSTLFEAPFGPRAIDAWREQEAHEPEQVYGVSADDAERMRLLLAQVSSSERGTRHLMGSVQVAASVGAAAGALSLSPQNSARYFMLGMAGALGILGAIDLIRTSFGEQMYADYVAQMTDPASDKARVVAKTERRLNALADGWRSWRHRLLGFSIALTAAGAGLMAYNEHLTLSADDRTTGRFVTGGLTAMGAVLILASMQATPVEQMRELWIHDPDLSRMPRLDLSLAPARGGAYVGLVGRF
jgi:hypothetical protein